MKPYYCFCFLFRIAFVFVKYDKTNMLEYLILPKSYQFYDKK